MDDTQIYLDNEWHKRLPEEMQGKGFRLQACKLTGNDAYVLALVPMSDEELETALKVPESNDDEGDKPNAQ